MNQPDRRGDSIPNWIVAMALWPFVMCVGLLMLGDSLGRPTLPVWIVMTIVSAIAAAGSSLGALIGCCDVFGRPTRGLIGLGYGLVSFWSIVAGIVGLTVVLK